jgi:hypothetical protein
LREKFKRVPEIESSGLSWQELYDWLDTKTVGEPNRQLVEDLREILQYFGLRSRQFLDDLASLARRRGIDAIGLESLEVLARWDFNRSI